MLMKFSNVKETKKDKFLMELCKFINGIGIHAKYFVENRLANFLIKDVSVLIK